MTGLVAAVAVIGLGAAAGLGWAAYDARQDLSAAREDLAEAVASLGSATAGQGNAQAELDLAKQEIAGLQARLQKAHSQVAIRTD
jgi:hypothetical protein